MLTSLLELLQRTNVKRTPAGTENVVGYPCHIENITVTGADGCKIVTRVWEVPGSERGMPVENESPIGDSPPIYSDFSFET